MSYIKHNFSSGDTLFASSLNAMEDQIAANEQTGLDLKSAITRNSFPLVTGFAVRTTNGFITTVNSTNWDFAAIPVEPGIDFDITTKIYGSTYYDVLIADITGKVIGQHQTAGSNREIVVNYAGTITDKSARILYVNTRAGYTPEIVLKTNASAITAAISRTQNTSIVVGCVNCGSYNHHVDGEPVKTDDEYLANWKAMLESCNFDVFNLEDSAFTGVFTQANIYEPIIVCAHHAQQQNQIHTESRIEVMDATDVTLPSTVTVDGVTYTSERFRGLCCRCIIGDKNVGIYAVHLTPSAGQEPMRKAQFEALIADAARFDEVIFTGDFNCQTIDEYKPFTDAGYTLGNGGYFGTFMTLRAIPADNIIVSDGLIITSFRKITDFVLNTDHRPIIAKIRVKA